MRRRDFLGLMGALATAGAAGLPGARPAAAQPDRLAWWDPATNAAPTPPDFVALEWRYLAGRISRSAEDFGFVVSLADYNPLPPVSTTSRNELLVMRQEFTGAQTHATRTYSGTLSYDGASGTYSFTTPDNPAVSATWRLDSVAQTYALSVAAPELMVTDLVLAPQGPLIAEGGDGEISSGNFSLNGVPVNLQSDYYADWVAISSGGQPLGLGRLDMQTIRPTFGTNAQPGFSHHWFALAATLADDTDVWVSGWEIVTAAATVWALTVVTGRGAWNVSSYTHESFSGAQPLAVRVLAYQAVPDTSPARRSGRRWRFRAGQGAPGDLLDVTITVPEGQYIQNARASSVTGITMQESLGLEAVGSVGGLAIRRTDFAIVESTYSEPGLPYLVGLPVLRG